MQGRWEGRGLGAPSLDPPLIVSYHVRKCGVNSTSDSMVRCRALTQYFYCANKQPENWAYSGVSTRQTDFVEG